MHVGPAAVAAVASGTGPPPSDTTSCAGVSLSMAGSSPTRGRRASSPPQWVQYYCYEL